MHFNSKLITVDVLHKTVIMEVCGLVVMVTGV